MQKNLLFTKNAEFRRYVKLTVNNNTKYDVAVYANGYISNSIHDITMDFQRVFTDIGAFTDAIYVFHASKRITNIDFGLDYSIGDTLEFINIGIDSAKGISPIEQNILDITTAVDNPNSNERIEINVSIGYRG